MVAPLVGGLTAFGIGEGLLVQSQWGASPWTVFAQGIAKQASISIGWATAVISCVVLVFWFPLRERPGFGTMTTVAVAHNPALKILYVVGAVALIGIGSAFYLTCGLGPGPRDGLMTSLHRHLHVSVVYVRLSIEVTILIVGWLLGGTVGVATAFFAATIGFSIGASLHVLDRLVNKSHS